MTDRELLRHAIATLAYRVAKTMRGAPEGFAEFLVAPGSNTPRTLVAHIGDLFDWALCLAEGRHEWHNSSTLSWEAGSARFFTALEAFDRRLASGSPLGFSAEELFQGPVADALTHVGQIAMLRRMAGCPIRGENYFKARIAAGRAGADQPAPVVEFD